MKKKTKTYIYFLGSILVIMGILLVFNIKMNQLDVGNACPKSWDISNYNINSKTATINIANALANGADCYGTYRVTRGISAFTNKADCEFYNFSWLIEPNSDGFQCILNNELWFTDKNYISNFTCTHSKCGVINTIDFGPCQINQVIGFDGFIVQFGDLKRGNDDSVSCTGTIVVSKKIAEVKQQYYRFTNNNCTPIQLYLNETTSIDSDAITCNNKIIVNATNNESTEPYYRYVNSSDSCTLVSILEKDKTSLDYEIESLCKANIKNITNTTKVTLIQCYKFKTIVQQAVLGNASNCDSLVLNGTSCGDFYYSKETCEDAYPEQNWITIMWNKYGLYISIIAVIVSIISSIVFLVKRK